MKAFRLPLVSLILAACGSPSRPESSELEGYYTHGARWIKNNLVVCWNDGGFKTEKGWVREAIERTWEAVIPINFKKWDSCKWSRDDQISMSIGDETPYTRGLGNELDKATADNHILLNFTYRNFTQECSRGSEEFRRRCIEADAIHEFGHALGLNHEHQRPDSTCQPMEAGGEPGDTMAGPYDKDSVMNYCNPVKHQNFLSAGDIATVQEMYGKR